MKAHLKDVTIYYSLLENYIIKGHKAAQISTEMVSLAKMTVYPSEVRPSDICHAGRGSCLSQR